MAKANGLKERATQLKNQLEIMTGKEKGDSADLIGMIVTINDFDFMVEQDGHRYAVFTTAEYPATFFFAGMVLTDHLMTLDQDGFKEDVKKFGLPTLLTQKKSKGNRQYTDVVFYPEG